LNDFYPNGGWAPHPYRAARRWPFVVSIIVLSLVAVGLGVGFAYSTYSAQEWRSAANKTSDELAKKSEDLVAMTKQRDDLKIEAQELQNRLDGVNSQLSDTQKQLDGVTSDFNTATDRVRSLADEKAQVGDDAAYMATLVAMSQGVTEEMDGCIGNLQKLQTYLVDFSSYDSESLIAYATEINAGCNKARADSEALSKKLAG
jgi:septal ring factor EnvC (AmiA/AmiB activator)